MNLEAIEACRCWWNIYSHNKQLLADGCQPVSYTQVLKKLNVLYAR